MSVVLSWSLCKCCVQLWGTTAPQLCSKIHPYSLTDTEICSLLILTFKDLHAKSLLAHVCWRLTCLFLCVLFCLYLSSFHWQIQPASVFVHHKIPHVDSATGGQTRAEMSFLRLAFPLRDKRRLLVATFMSVLDYGDVIYMHTSWQYSHRTPSTMEHSDVLWIKKSLLTISL